MTFDVQPGSVFGIGGPNGAGKTTMFDVISGVQQADSGEVIFDGQAITRLKPHQICHAGIARTFQLNAAFETMTVRENLLISTHHGHDPHEIPKVTFHHGEHHDADEALAVVGLAGRADRTVSDLTLLDQKLLMIASAIATKPKLLLLDEPVGGLIPREIEQVEKIIAHLTEVKGMTIILIEHVMRFLTGLSSEVMIMNYGEKLYHGTPEGLAEDRQVVDVYLGEGASAQLAQSPKAGKDGKILADVAAVGNDDLDDSWAREVRQAARQLVRQHRSGRLYPIDYMKLERLLDQRREEEKGTRVSRAARGLTTAHAKGADLAQHFELLERMLDEAQSLKRDQTAASVTPSQRPEDKRALLIEQAAGRLVDAHDRQFAGADQLEELRAALSWETSDRKDPSKGRKGEEHGR
ncbi:MAG: hypothetical protein Kilf2KO_41640 [Rhodospirillales bacterium]